MTSVGIDEIISKLSSKFNRIFTDREFVACVSEDLQTIIENENKCCVLVFPALSPNYLRVVRYQTKLFDLAVITLGSGSSRSVGVCHKKYLLSNTTEVEEPPKTDAQPTKSMAENATSSSRKKRPPIQLYVPPAQRKSRLSEKINTQRENPRSDNTQNCSSRCDKEKSRSSLVNVNKGENTEVNYSQKVSEINFPENKSGSEVQYDNKNKDSVIFEMNCSNLEEDDNICFCTEDIDNIFPSKQFSFSYPCKCMKFLLFKHIFPYSKLLVFSITRMKHSFHCLRWNQKSDNVLVEEVQDRYLENCSIVNSERPLFRNLRKPLRVNLFTPNILDFRKNFSLDKFSEFQNTYYLCGDILIDLPEHGNLCYLSIPQYEVFDNELKPQDYLDCYQNSDSGLLYLEDFIKSITNSIVVASSLRREDLVLDSFLEDIQNSTESPQLPCENDKEVKCDKNENIRAKKENANELTNSTPEKKKIRKQIDRVIVLDDRSKIEPTRTGTKSPPRIQEKDTGKHNEHEQEKEIMRKAKQNINRKTRPIIKYVDDDNDTLRIGKSDNVNNWEDLFDEDGELQEDIFTEIIQKVGPEVRIVKATEDYSAYASKQAEELEHMVELYDFPATLETHDLISAFSLLNSDSMYVKWVDDTRALLVLGSSTQAQKAIELSNSLIKVRPMSCASRLALEKAHHSDLKPAMKRPQTNLQTARRLITSHLGAKSRVSKEQSAREKEDLRLAKEMKKQAKQNERDAWEGNLRSAIN